MRCCPGPLGPLTPDTAVVLPLTVSGRSEPIGVLAVGVNPYRPLNPEYRAFFTVVARQVRVALGDTVAYEVERLRSQVLADLDRAKMEFFQNVSHELRTPLTVLLAPLRNLLAGVRGPAGGRAAGPAGGGAGRGTAAHHGGRAAGFLRRGGRHPEPGPAAHRPGGADRADLQHVPGRRRTRRPDIPRSRCRTRH